MPRYPLPPIVGLMTEIPLGFEDTHEGSIVATSPHGVLLLGLGSRYAGIARFGTSVERQIY